MQSAYTHQFQREKRHSHELIGYLAGGLLSKAISCCPQGPGFHCTDSPGGKLLPAKRCAPHCELQLVCNDRGEQLLYSVADGGLSDGASTHGKTPLSSKCSAWRAIAPLRAGPGGRSTFTPFLLPGHGFRVAEGGAAGQTLGSETRVQSIRC